MTIIIVEDSPSKWEHILNVIPRKRARNDIQGTSGNTATITEGHFISSTISKLVFASELSQTKAGSAGMARRARELEDVHWWSHTTACNPN